MFGTYCAVVDTRHSWVHKMSRNTRHSRWCVCYIYYDMIIYRCLYNIHQHHCTIITLTKLCKEIYKSTVSAYVMFSTLDFITIFAIACDSDHIWACNLCVPPGVKISVEISSTSVAQPSLTGQPIQVCNLLVDSVVKSSVETTSTSVVLSRSAWEIQERYGYLYACPRLWIQGRDLYL